MSHQITVAVSLFVDGRYRLPYFTVVLKVPLTVLPYCYANATANIRQITHKSPKSAEST